MPSRRRSKRRVAILGGGQAALTAAFQLTDPCNPKHRDYDVTVYQLGWRLGGKGATGRPQARPWAAHRIEEHGLHNWFGFYDNSFRQIRSCYEQLERPPGAPLATFDEAFEPANQAVFVETIEGRPRLWSITNITNDAEPGSGGLFLEPWQYAQMTLEMIERAIGGSPVAAQPHHHVALAGALKAARVHTRAAHAADDLGGIVERLALASLPYVLTGFLDLLWWALGGDLETAAKDEERRLWILANLGISCIIGAIRDGVMQHGFDVINDVDFRHWLEKHAYPDGGVMLRSPLVEAVYTGSFAYPAGNTRVAPGGAFPRTEDMEAGVALMGFVRTALTYKGAFAYRFRAGTADTCYAPMFEVLRRRGVKFRFFHRVKRLGVGGGRIDKIVIGRQAGIKGGDDREYDPLIDVAGLPCWPDTPLWDQLMGGARLKSKNADFENPDQALRARERELTLELGKDFDDVVLGISIAALPPIVEDLVAQSGSWADSLANVKTVSTQALQLWLTKRTPKLGFGVPHRPIVTWIYDADSPLNVWGDFTELLPMEGWPDSDGPAALAYFCSTLEDPVGWSPDPFPHQAAADGVVRANALQLLEKGLPVVLPGTAKRGQFDWDLLYDPRPAPGRGAARLDAQYYRANVAPTERYVLSVTGSSRFRLPAHDPALANLYLAGDWTDCTLNAGCMEAATMSGMLAANALSGYPLREDIVGVDFLRPQRAAPKRRR